MKTLDFWLVVSVFGGLWLILISILKPTSKPFFMLFNLMGLALIAATYAGEEPSAAGIAFLTYTSVLLIRWGLTAKPKQVEALSKWALSITLGIFSLEVGWLSLQSEAAQIFWPFSDLTAQAGLWYEALAGALIACGLFLLIGLPPLQHGWPELLETLEDQEHICASLLLRTASVVMLWRYVPGLRESLSPPMLSILAGGGIIGLTLSRLVGGMQMSVKRSLAYEGMSLSFPLFVILGLSARDNDGSKLLLQAGLLATVIGSLFLSHFYRQFIRQKLFSQDFNSCWDDIEVPDAWRHSHRLCLYWQFIQIIGATVLLGFFEQYGLLLLCTLYGFSTLSVLKDPAAFQLRVHSKEV